MIKDKLRVNTNPVFDEGEYIQVRVWIKKDVWNNFRLLAKANNNDIRILTTKLFETWIRAYRKMKENDG